MDDSGTCKPGPSGQEYYRPFGMDAKTITFIVAPLIALTPAFVLFGIPALWQLLGSLFGTYLRRKTDGRRTKILEVIAEDEKQYAAKEGKKTVQSGSDKGEEDGWEKVEACPSSRAPDGNNSTGDWDGIVGFFHPFWYVFRKLRRDCGWYTDGQ